MHIFKLNHCKSILGQCMRSFIELEVLNDVHIVKYFG